MPVLTFFWQMKTIIHTEMLLLTSYPPYSTGVRVCGTWWLSPSAHRCSSTHLNRQEVGQPRGRASLQIKKPLEKKGQHWLDVSLHFILGGQRRGEARRVLSISTIQFGWRTPCSVLSHKTRWSCSTEIRVAVQCSPTRSCCSYSNDGAATLTYNCPTDSMMSSICRAHWVLADGLWCYNL